MIAEPWKVVYDSTLTRLAYMRDDGPTFVLWDLQNNQAIWTLKKYSVKSTPPMWSPDEMQLAVVAMNQPEDNWDRLELFLVTRDGQAQKWVDLQGYHPTTGQGTLRWSPNGRYIAFWEWSYKAPILILDTIKKQLLDYCIIGAAGYGDFVWSPDSTQVTVTRYEAPSIVIDVEKGIASQITQDWHFRPVGWMVNSSEIMATPTP